MRILPKQFYFLAGRLIPMFLIAACVFLLSALIWMFGFSDTTDIGSADIYWVFYLHIASSAVAIVFYFVMALASLVTLTSRTSLYGPMTACAIAPTGFVMTVFAIGTGALFGRPIWGQYWVWDARLSGLLILLLFFGAFITFANSKGFHLRRHTDVRSALVAVLGLIVLPVSYWFFGTMAPMAHDLSKSLERSSGQDAYILMISFTLMLGFYAIGMVLSRSRTIILERERRAVWAQEDALEGKL